MGGWAVDLYLGRTTRRHSDIDLAVFPTTIVSASQSGALRQHRLVSVPGAEPAGEFFDGGPCRVEITYLVETSPRPGGHSRLRTRALRHRGAP